MIIFVSSTYLTNKVIASQQDADTLDYILKNIFTPIQKSLGLNTSSLSIPEIAKNNANTQKTLNFQETVQNIGCS
jgi:hypothetical protein